MLDRAKILCGSRTQTYSETSYYKEETKYKTEPRSCMILRLKLMGKLVSSKERLSARQNQGLAHLVRTKVLHGPRTQTYGETSYFKEEPKC